VKNYLGLGAKSSAPLDGSNADYDSSASGLGDSSRSGGLGAGSSGPADSTSAAGLDTSSGDQMKQSFVNRETPADSDVTDGHGGLPSRSVDPTESDGIMSGRDHEARLNPGETRAHGANDPTVSDGVMSGRDHEARFRPQETRERGPNDPTVSDGVMSGRDHEARFCPEETRERDPNDPTVSDGVMSGRDHESRFRPEETRERDPNDPTVSDGVMEGRDHAARGEHEGLAEHEKKLSDKQTGSARENTDAIPTAGGIKLGQKHWGESSIVPDNPKPRASDAGVSSVDGQPTDQVRDNTQANTGGAAPPR